FLVRLRTIDRLAQISQQLWAHAVALMGTVQPDGRDPVSGHLVLDHLFFSHDCTLCSCKSDIASHLAPAARASAQPATANGRTRAATSSALLDAALPAFDLCATP